MKQYIGWDCAYKTLAWSHVEINTNILRDLDTQADELYAAIGAETVQRLLNGQTVDICALFATPEVVRALHGISTTLKGFVNYKSAGVKDLLCGRKVADVAECARTALLYDFMRPFVPEYACQPIIERQAPKIGAKVNNKSTVVSHQLEYHYVTASPIIIDPKLKNMFALGPGLDYDTFLRAELPRYKKAEDARYTARKKHSKANFLLFLRVFGLEHILVGISKTVYDDLADSTMQIFAHLVTTNEFKNLMV